MAEPGTIHLFGANVNAMKLSDLTGADVRLALVSSSYAPDITASGDAVWADVSAHEIPAGTGYVAGGFALTGEAVSVANANDGYRFSTGNAAWTASGVGIAAWRYGVLRVNGSLWGKASPLLGYFLGDSTPADVPLTTSGNELGVNCPDNGWFRLAAE